MHYPVPFKLLFGGGNERFKTFAFFIRELGHASGGLLDFLEKCGEGGEAKSRTGAFGTMGGASADHPLFRGSRCYQLPYFLLKSFEVEVAYRSEIPTQVVPVIQDMVFIQDRWRVDLFVCHLVVLRNSCFHDQAPSGTSKLQRISYRRSKSVALDHVVDGPQADPEQLRGCLAVPLADGQRMDQSIPLQSIDTKSFGITTSHPPVNL